jgi:transcriptional regulator with XRE-family HTH domain
METLGSRIKIARLQEGMTQAELARRSGVGQGDISKLENGTVAGSTKVVQLASALGCDPYWLATGAGEPWGQRAAQEMEVSESGNVVGLPVHGASEFLEGNVEVDTRDDSVAGVILGFGVLDAGYALKVRGDRNAPALKDGQFVVLEPTLVAPGDLGLFYLQDGRVLLRELLRETEDAYYVDSAAWGARQTLPKHSIVRTEHVVAVVSPSRWRAFT